MNRYRRRPRDFAYMLWIKSLPCCVCAQHYGSEAAHTGPRAFGRKSSDRSCIPLCPAHHRDGRESLHTLGPRGFEERHGFIIAELVTRLSASREG
jgi:hypothetical protein